MDLLNWLFLATASVAAGAATYYRFLHREVARRRETRPSGSFAYHDALLQSVVAARMAIELEQPDRASEFLDGVIGTTRSTMTGFLGAEELD